MSTGRRPPAKQLDMPLVWELEPIPDEPTGGEGPFAPPPARAARPSSGRLVLAAVADLGALLLGVALAWVVTAVLGGALDPFRLVLAALVGVEIFAVVGVACLWSWRGTLGMLLLGATLEGPLPFGRAAGVWVWWLVCLPLAGLPLVMGSDGKRGLERVAGVRVSLRSSPSAA